MSIKKAILYSMLPALFGFLTIKAQDKKMENVLLPKQQHIVAIAAFEAKGDLDNLEKALNEALEEGLTVNELKATLAHLYAYTGFPRSLNALGTLQRVCGQRKSEGKKLLEGKAASALPDDYDALARGTEVQAQLVGKKGYRQEFSPEIDYYLKAHLFGDVFSGDVLTFAERELATVSALSALSGVAPQLKSHLSGARNMGVSESELQALPEVLASRVGETEAYRVKKALAELEGKTFAEVPPIENRMFPKGEPNTAYAQYFTGNSYLAPLLREGLPVSNVTFEPRCRNNWHIHHKASQILICVGGDGWYQEWGKPARKLHPGDVVSIPAEVKHWHGATADSWFQHIAFSITEEGASNEWLEPVSDEVYDALK